MIPYWAMGYAKQAAVVETGVEVAPGNTRKTPSSVEQKARFPVAFGAIGAPAATNAELSGPPPPPVIPVARKKYPLLPAEPGIACARALSRRQPVAGEGVQGVGPPKFVIAAAYPTDG